MTVVAAQELRRLSFSVAYRMLGSVAEAEDVVQEALLRLHDASEVDNPEAWLTTTTTRLAIDVLRSARVRREHYAGDWLPEPIVEDAAVERVEDEETISLAFLVLLERLTPEERAVLVLRDAFDYDFAEIAQVVGKSEANTRQILSRARRHVDAERPRFDPDPAQRFALAQRFLAAARDGDMDALVARSRPTPCSPATAAARRSPSGGRWSGRRRSPTRCGPSRCAASPGTSASSPRSSTASRAFARSRPTAALVNVMAVDVVGGRIARIYTLLNPDKIGHLGEISDIGLRPQYR